jgi:hypothetical protein
LQTNKEDKPHKKTNSHHVPSTFKKFWRKGKKNKSRDVASTITEESRDEDMEMLCSQPTMGAATVVTTMTEAEKTTPAPVVLTTANDASIEVRDDVESNPLEIKGSIIEEPKQTPTVEEKGSTVKSQSQDNVNASSDSTTNNNSLQLPKKEVRAFKPKKQRETKYSTSRDDRRQGLPPLSTPYNTNERTSSHTYSQGSSDSDSWNEFEDRDSHIYLQDNESVSVLTKDYMRDPNIIDVLSLDAVMEVVNKGIISSDDDAKHNSRLGGNIKDGDENSVDGLMNCLLNALDCCGDNSFVTERQCYVDRCHRRSNGRFSSKIVLNDDGQNFVRQRKNRRNEVGDNDMDRIEGRGIPGNTNNDVGGKSVSWADDAVDNIVLDGSFIKERSLREQDLDKEEEEKLSNKQQFIRSRSNSSDGKGSASVRSAIKNSFSFQNMKNIVANMQCAAGMKQAPVDGDIVYEQHRHAVVAGKILANDINPTIQNDTNWRDMVNETDAKENWRAAVNDRLNYQGPNSPASSNGGNLSPVQGMYGVMNGELSHPHLHPWEQNSSMWAQNHANMDPHVPSVMPMTRMPSGHQSVNTAPPPPMSITGRVPSMGNRSVVSNMMNMSLSIDSDDIGDKYGMQCEEEAQMPVARNYGNYDGAASNGILQHGNNSQYPSQQLMTQDSIMERNGRYTDGMTGAVYGNTASNNAMQAYPSHDTRINNGRGRQDVYAYGNANMPQQPFHNGMGHNLTQQPHMTSGMMQHGQPMMQEYDYQQQQLPMSQVPPRRTFMA